MTKILILTSGNVSKLDNFKEVSPIDGVEITLSSFSDINYDTSNEGLRVGKVDLKLFNVIYFRLVSKSLEIATLVTNYAIKNNIKLVDELYSSSLLLPMSLGKSIEMRKLHEAGISIPRTLFGTFEGLEFPFIVKSTSGQKAREVWMVKNQEELDALKLKFEKGKFYFSQELVPNAERVRVLVIGDRAVGAIKRQTKWNKSEAKETLATIPTEIAELAVNSAKAVGLDISGVDILVNSQTKEMFVIEANAAPAWKLINKYCGIKVEDEIIKYLQTKI